MEEKNNKNKIIIFIVLIALIGAFFLAKNFLFNKEEKSFSSYVQTLYDSLKSNSVSNGVYESYGKQLSLPELQGYNYKLEMENGVIKYLCVSNNEYSYIINANNSNIDYKNVKESQTCSVEVVETLSLSIELDGGTSSLNSNYNGKKGETIEIIIPTKEGYRFIGWNLTGGGSITSNEDEKSSKYTFGDNNGTITASWSKLYTLTINVNEGSIDTDLYILGIKDEEVKIPAPIKKGYLFKGWSLSGKGTISFNKPIETSENTFVFDEENAILTANWSKLYTLNLDLKDGIITGNTSFEKIEKESVVLPNPTKDGYKFTGWILTGGGKINDGKYTFGNKDALLTASWSKIYNLTINLDGGTSTNKLTQTGIKKDIVTLTIPIKEGYRFTGWTLSGKGNIVSNKFTFQDGDATLIANWSKIHTLTINLDGGSLSIVTPKTGIKGEKITIPNPTKDGYRFDRWTLSGNGTFSSNVFTFGEGNATLSASWIKINRLTINLDGGSISINNTQTGIKGEYVNIPNPTKEGYRFDKWILSGSGSLSSNKFTFGDGNATLTASWIKEHTLTINTNGGSISINTTQIGIKGDQITIPIPTKDGYRFDKWTLSGSGNFSSNKFTFDENNATLTASWIKEYTLTINTNGGSISINTTQTGIKGEQVPIPIPTKEGYRFDKWILSGSGNFSSNKFTFGEGNATLTASWIKEYTLTINTNGGSISINTTHTGVVGDKVTIPDPTKKDNEFIKWILSGNGSISDGEFTFGEGNSTLTASWKNTLPVLTINVGNGSISINKTQPGTNGKTLSIPVPTWSNHTFLGWSLSGGGAITNKKPVPTSTNTYTYAEEDALLTANWSEDLTPNANGQAIYNAIYDLYINHGLEYCYANPSEKQYRADAFNGIKSFSYNGNNYYATDCNGFVGIAIWNAMGVAGVKKGSATTGSVPSSITPAGPSGSVWVLRTWAKTYFNVVYSGISEDDVYKYARVGDLIGAYSTSTTHIQVYAGHGKVIGNTGGNSTHCGVKSGTNNGTISFRTLPAANTTTTGNGYTIMRAK